MTEIAEEPRIVEDTEEIAAAPVFHGYLPSLMSALMRAQILTEQLGKSCFVYPADTLEGVVVAEGWEASPHNGPYIEVYRDGQFTIHPSRRS